MCVCVYPSQAIPWKLLKVIIVKLGTVTASDVIMHHMLIIITLTFIQGHTDLNHENNKGLIISEIIIIQAMHIKFAVKIASLTKGINDRCQSDDLDPHSWSQVHLILDYLLTCNISDNI